MANETHTITITAKDGTSQTFKAIGAAATKSGQEMERAAQRGADAQKKLQDRLTATGAAVGGLVGITSKLGQAHLTESRQLGALERAYGSQAESINKLADEMQGLGIASDDAVRISALGAQSLARNYGFTADQITQLITVSADLSAVTFDQYGNQLQLADVTQRVAGAMRGEGEAAEILGLNMSDSAVAAEAAARGMTTYGTSMSEAEKAQFRFTLLLEQTASSQGAAGQQADTLAGKVNAMKLQVLDAGSAFGGMLGPAGEAAAVLGDVALAAPLVGGALGKIAGSAKVASLASTVLSSSLIGGGGVAAGLTAVGAAAAPLVVTMAALAAPIGIATYLIADQDNVMRRAAEATAENNEQLQKYLEWLGQVAGTITPVTAAIEAQGGAADKMLDFFRDTNTEALVSMDGISGFTVNMSDLRGELNNLSPENFQTVLDVARNWGIVWNDPSTWSTEGINEVAFAIVSLNNEQNTAAAMSVDMARGMAVAAYGADDFARKTDTAAAASAASATAMGFEIDALDELIKQREAANATALTKQEGRGKEQDAYLAAERAAAERVITEAIENQALGLSVQTTDMAELKAMAAERAAAELEVAQAVLAATQSYAGMIGTTNALDSGISVVIGGLDNLGSGVEKVKTSLEGLVGVQGEWGTIDDMLAAGLITWDQYTAAVEASYAVTQDAASSQDWMNKILAMQAPLMADLVSGQENYIEGISRMPADQQLLTLAYMDSAEAGKALELQTLAISAANGELGAGGGEFAAGIIEGAAQADPILKAMLVDMGLISVGADGTVTVNMAGDAMTEMEALTNSVDALTVALGGVPPVHLTVDDSEVANWAPPATAFEWPVNLKIGGGGGDASAVDQLLAFGGIDLPAVDLPVNPVVSETAAPTLDPITWPVDLKINPAAAPELPKATAVVDLDSTAFDAAYGTVTANVATLDALTASVSVSILSAVGGKVQGITNEVSTIDALTASVEIGADSSEWFEVSNAVATSVGSVDAWSATIDIGGDGATFWDVMNNVSVSKDQVDGWNPIVSIGGDGQPFWDAMNNVSVSKDQVDGWNPIVSIGGDSSGWFGASNAVAGSVGSVDAWSATVDIGANAAPYYAALPTTGVSLGTNYIDVVSRQVGGFGPHLHGGMVEPALHGRMPGNATALVGETGPELVSLPYGSSVTPASATKARLGNRGGGGGDVYIETLVVQSNDARQLVDTMRGYAIMGARP